MDASAVRLNRNTQPFPRAPALPSAIISIKRKEHAHIGEAEAARFYVWCLSGSGLRGRGFISRKRKEW